MVKINEAFELRYKKSGYEFEVLVDFEKLEEYRKDPEKISIYDVLADSKIFKDQKKGEIAPEKNLIETFPNLKEEQILKEILINGECQIPTAYLNKLREEKKNLVINYISQNAVNPATNTKYTASMIEREISNIKYNFSANKDYHEQAEDVLKIMKKNLPIAINKIIFEISIPPQYSNAFYGEFRKYGKITKEYYDRDANLRIHIEINSSRQDEVENYIKKHTNSEGSYHIPK